MDRPLLFGKFCLLERTSVGGMAEVFRAKPLGAPDPNKYFAVKRILPHLAEDVEFIKMFVDEARLTVRLRHENIVQTYELGQFQSSHYIAMEFIAGKDLLAFQKLVRRNKTILDIDMACHIVREIAKGLDYAHRKTDESGNPLGIIHRDISPQNILVSWDGKVRVIDFGIAKAASQSTRTQAGVLKGKFGYMSPEQVRGETIDHRSDIFAMGTLLWELLTNQRLFKAGNHFETLTLIGAPDVKRPSTINERIPAELDRIAMKALTADPNDRYDWASDLAEDLHSYLMSQKPPYHRSQLTTWLRSAFREDFEQEKEKRETFRGINTADDVRRIFDDSYGTGGDDDDQKTEDATQIWDVDVAPDSDADVEDYVANHTVVQAGGLDLSDYEDFVDAPDTIDETRDLVESRIEEVTQAPIEELRVSAKSQYEVEATQITATGGSPAELLTEDDAEFEDEDDSEEFPTVDGRALAEVPTPPQGIRADASATGPIKTVTGTGKQAVAEVARLSPGNRNRIFVASAAVFLVVGLFSAVVFVMMGEEEVQVVEEPRGRMLVEVEPTTELEIYVGGEWRGAESPLRLDDLEPGSYRVEIDHPDYLTWDTEVSVSETDITTVNADLAASAQLVMTWEDSPEGMRIYIDGELLPVGDEARIEVELARGEYLVEARGPGIRPIRTTTVVESDELNELALEWMPSNQLTLTGDNELEVMLDGQSLGNLSMTLEGLDLRRVYDLKVGDFETALGYPERGKHRIDADEFARFESREKDDFGWLILQVSGDHDWEVIVDDIPIGLMAPLPDSDRIPVAAGPRTVGLQRGHERYDFRIQIVAEETTRFRPDLP